MTSEAVVDELFAAFAARDLARMERVVHPDCQFWAEGTSTAAGRVEPYHGPKGAEAYFEDAARFWDHLQVQPQDVRSAGNGVICFGIAVGRLRGEAEEQRVPVIWVLRLREGRIVYGRAVRTAAEAQELTGADVETGSG